MASAMSRWPLWSQSPGTAPAVGLVRTTIRSVRRAVSPDESAASISTSQVPFVEGTPRMSAAPVPGCARDLRIGAEERPASSVVVKSVDPSGP